MRVYLYVEEAEKWHDAMVAILEEFNQKQEQETCEERKKMSLYDELRAERKATVETFKRLCLQNADCHDCKRLGIFEKCQKAEKAGKKCEEFYSEFLNEMLMIKGAENDKKNL